MCFGATTVCTLSISQLTKVVRGWYILYILTWKCASRHNGVHFFDISITKTNPDLVCFVYFDLEIYFAAACKKYSVSRLSYLFAHLHLLSSDSFSFDLLSSDSFSSLCLCPALLFIYSYYRKFDF